MTEADKQRLTPVVNQAIERLEREVGIEEISNPLIYGYVRNNNFSTSASLFHINLLNELFVWAYKYRQYCVYLNRTCSSSIPLDELIKIGKDIIQHGFLSDFVKEGLLLDNFRQSGWIKIYEKPTHHMV